MSSRSRPAGKAPRACDRPGLASGGMDVRDLVTGHYSVDDLTGTIVSALGNAGLDTDRLGPADLFAVDQLHAGGPDATKHALDRLELGPGTRLLDVGSGIGGTSRMAAMAGAAV